MTEEVNMATFDPKRELKDGVFAPTLFNHVKGGEMRGAILGTFEEESHHIGGRKMQFRIPHERAQILWAPNEDGMCFEGGHLLLGSIHEELVDQETGRTRKILGAYKDDGAWLIRAHTGVCNDVAGNGSITLTKHGVVPLPSESGETPTCIRWWNPKGFVTGGRIPKNRSAFWLVPEGSALLVVGLYGTADCLMVSGGELHEVESPENPVMLLEEYIQERIDVRRQKEAEKEREEVAEAAA